LKSRRSRHPFRKGPPVPPPLALLFALPFLVRLLYFLETRRQPFFQWSFLVAFVNQTFAADLARGEGAPYTLYRSPWYPLAVSWIYRLAGVEPMAVRLVQWTLGGVTCLLVYRLGRLLLGERAARVALVLSALFVPAVFYEGELLEQSLATFLLAAGALLLARAWEIRFTLAAAAAGSALWCAAFLLRPDLLAGAPLLIAAMALAPRAGRERVRALGVFGFVGVVALALLLWPGLLINVRENRSGINAAINLHIGNNAQADGHDALLPETPELPTVDPEARRDHMTGLDLAGTRYALAATGGGLDSVAPFWLDATRRFVADSPWAELKLLGRKTLLFFNGYLLGTQKDLYFLREHSWTLRALLWCAGLCFPLGLILPLAAIGSCATPMAASRRLMLLCVPAGCLATTLVFFHDARFLMPAIPFLMLSAASGVLSVLDAIRARRWSVPAVLAALLILSNVDWLGTHVMHRAAEEFRVGTMHLDAGDTAAAEAAYRRAVLADPGFVPALDNLVTVAGRAGDLSPAIEFLSGLASSGHETPPLTRSLASLQAAAGRDDDALATLRAGRERHPDDPALAMDVATTLMQRGDCGEALGIAQGVLSGAPGDERAPACAGYCLETLGRHAEAIAVLESGLRARPDDATLLGLLGEAYAALGRREEEQRCYRRILAVEPRHALAALRLARSLAAQGDRGEALRYARLALSLGHPDAASLVRALEGRDLESHPPR